MEKGVTLYVRVLRRNGKEIVFYLANGYDLIFENIIDVEIFNETSEDKCQNEGT